MADILPDIDEEGMYVCKKCKNRIFDSNARFAAAGIDGASFRKAVDGGAVMSVEISGGQVKTKCICSSCGLFLGYVSNDGKDKGDTHPEAGRRFTALPDILEFTSAAEIIKKMKNDGN